MVEIIDFAAQGSAIDGLFVITMKQVTDERGTVRELFRTSAFDDVGLGGLEWRQVNVTETKRGGIRGLHAESMNKLVAVAAGEAFGAYVDLRPGSTTRGAVVTVELRPGMQVFVPRGVGNGFQGVSDVPVQYVYCFDDEWQPGMAGMACNPLDPALAIPWPVPVDPDDRAQVSEKDLNAPMFADLPEELA
jgi:dTDP-4-dehydrorhamnose 3,5-epimerase